MLNNSFHAYYYLPWVEHYCFGHISVNKWWSRLTPSDTWKIKCKICSHCQIFYHF